MNKIKNTSFSYGNEYQNQQVEKYKNRNTNHWKYRLEIFHKLLNQAIALNFNGINKSDITVVDIGCSIGTFALESARFGYNSFGIDFDNEAITIANQLAKEENLNVKFICGDVSQSFDLEKKIDIAVCFDIFEHLHDDELGALFQSIKSKLSQNGILLYHTFPTEYDYIFFEKKFLHLPLIPFSIFGKKFFEKIVKIYASKIDILLILFKGKNYKELIISKSHCNPTSKARLSDILQRAGFKNIIIETSQLYNLYNFKQNVYKRHSICYRNLYGIAELNKVKQ